MTRARADVADELIAALMLIPALVVGIMALAAFDERA